MDEEREMVLRMLKEGKISVEEADALLQELVDQRVAEGSGADEPVRPAAALPGEDLRNELRSVFQDLAESFRRDVMPELRRTSVVLRPTFQDLLRGLRGLVEGRAEATAEEPMASGDILELRNAWGDVRVAASGDDRMHLRAVKRVWSLAAEDAQHDAEALTVQVRRQGSTVQVSASRPEGRRTRVDFEITVPSGVEAHVDVAKGDVRLVGLGARAELQVVRGDVQIADLAGPLRINVANGDLEIRQVRGDVQIDVRSGDVACHDIEGPVHGRLISGDVSIDACRGVALDLINGDVAITRVAGPVDVTTKSGDVAVADARSSDVRVRTLSGDVGLELLELPEGSVLVETLSGDIKLTLPPEAHATIEAATRSGEVRSALPLTDQVTGFRSLRGVLNGPGATVRLRATSGDIRIGAPR